MALVMQLYYTGKNGDARRFAEEMTSTGVVGRIRAEEGNLCYSYYTSMDEILRLCCWWTCGAIRKPWITITPRR